MLYDKNMQHVKTIVQMFCNEREKACRMCNINLKYIRMRGKRFLMKSRVISFLYLDLKGYK